MAFALRSISLSISLARGWERGSFQRGNEHVLFSLHLRHNIARSGRWGHDRSRSEARVWEVRKGWMTTPSVAPCSRQLIYISRDFVWEKETRAFFSLPFSLALSDVSPHGPIYVNACRYIYAWLSCVHTVRAHDCFNARIVSRVIWVYIVSHSHD